MRLKNLTKQALRWPVEMFLRAYLSLRPAGDISLLRPQRILVFAYHGLGNFIMYTPALKQLRERYPDARIDLQVGNNTGCEEVLDGSAVFDNIYNLPYAAGLRAWTSRLMEMRRVAYDVTINEFHSHSWVLALLVSFSGARWRVGHVTSPGWSRRFSRYSFVFNVPVQMKENEHEVDRYFDLMEPLNVRRKALSEATQSIHLSGEDEEYAARFFERAGIGTTDVVVGVQPGTSTNMRWKQWPVDRFRDLMEKLVENHPYIRIVMFGSAHETHISSDLMRGLEANVTLAVGKTTVKQVAAMIKRCDAMLCNDSGLMHIAVAVGTPVVAIYGPTDIRRTRPIGPIHTVIRHEMDCSPCFRLEGEDSIHSCPHHNCLVTITADEVLSAIERRLEKAGSSNAGGGENVAGSKAGSVR